VGVAPDGLRVVDGARRTMTFFPLPGATHAAIDPAGRLYATTPRAVYATDARGALVRIYEAEGDTLHGLVASGATVWFADGPELGVVDGARVAETTGARIAPDAALSPSSTGDVWVVSGGGLARYGRVAAAPTPAVTWTQSLAPVFARACATCHRADGVSGIDLSTAGAWEAERSAIHERVIVSRSMPPEGHELSDADREAIRSWTEADPR
jgi:hypothetical protein